MPTRLVRMVLGPTALLVLFGCGSSGSTVPPPPDSDGGTVTPPPGVDWAGCPTADQHVADPTWTATLVEPADLVLCTATGENNSGQPISQVFRKKLMLRLPAGTYRLPDEGSSGAYTLPLCTRTGPDGTAQGIAGPGTIARDPFVVAQQPLAIGDARMSIYDLAAGKAIEVCVDGDDCDLQSEGGGDTRFMGEDCTPDVSAWDTPRPQVFRRRRLTIAFERGELTFDVVTIVGSDDPDIIGLYPIAGPLLSISGRFDDTRIETNDYWEMAYWAAHHVFGQFFGVLLPAPVGDTCALEVAETGFDEPPSYTVYRLNCDFERIGELAVESVTSDDL